MAAHAIEMNGIGLVRTPTGVGVMVTRPHADSSPMQLELEYGGRRLKDEFFQPVAGACWRDYLGKAYDHLRIVMRVRQKDRVLAELSLPDEEYPLPFMVRQGDQKHITENYVSIPPALTITDQMGAVWTLGFKVATKEQSPEGEFAFNVLRDGIDMHEIASRIERRNNQIKIFTKDGWKKWNQDGLYFV